MTKKHSPEVFFEKMTDVEFWEALEEHCFGSYNETEIRGEYSGGNNF
jgi:hypothetical protein